MNTLQNIDIREMIITHEIIEENTNTTASLILSLFEDDFCSIDGIIDSVIDYLLKSNRESNDLNIQKIQELIFEYIFSSEKVSFSSFVNTKNINNLFEHNRYVGNGSLLSCSEYKVLSSSISLIFNSKPNIFYELKNRRPHIDIEYETIKMIMSLCDFIIDNHNILEKIYLVKRIEEERV